MEHLERADVGIAVVKVIKGKESAAERWIFVLTVGKLTCVHPCTPFMFDSLETGMEV